MVGATTHNDDRNLINLFWPESECYPGDFTEISPTFSQRRNRYTEVNP